MDKVRIAHSDKPLIIRTGHTPVTIGLLAGSLVAAIPALVGAATRSAVISRALPWWAAGLFYLVLLVSAGTALYAVWKPMPAMLNMDTYPVIVRKLVLERVGIYGVSGILLCFSCAALAASGWNGLSAAGWLVGVAIGLVFRAAQTNVDVDKLHSVAENGITTHTTQSVDDPDQDQ